MPATRKSTHPGEVGPEQLWRRGHLHPGGRVGAADSSGRRSSRRAHRLVGQHVPGRGRQAAPGEGVSQRRACGRVPRGLSSGGLQRGDKVKGNHALLKRGILASPYVASAFPQQE